MAKQDWHDAGLTDNQGHIGKPIPTGRLLVPGKIEIGESTRPLRELALIWRLGALDDRDLKNPRNWPPTHPAKSPRYIRPQAAMLDQFVNLWSKPAAASLKFARLYGVFMFDASGSPGKLASDGIEPLSRWRELSRAAYAMVNIGASLRDHTRGGFGEQEDWEAILGSEPYPSSKPEARRELQHCVNHWLTKGRLGVRLEEGKSDWQTELDYGAGLYGAIAAQILLAASGSEGYYSCSDCRRIYHRPPSKKRPKPGEMNFCDACTPQGKKSRLSLAEADRRRREKVVEAKRLHAAGAPKKEIERALNLKPGGATRLLAR